MSTKTHTPISGFGSFVPIVLELLVRFGWCPGPVKASCPAAAWSPVLLLGLVLTPLPGCELDVDPETSPLAKSSDRYPPICSTCLLICCSATRFTEEFCAERTGPSPGAYIPFFSSLALINQGSRLT